MKGYSTRQRERILKLLQDNRDRHVTVDDIYTEARSKGYAISMPTIYRYFDLLTREGLLRKYLMPGGACYQYADCPEGNSSSHHHHLLCDSCQKIIHLECDALSGLQDHLKSEHSFSIDSLKTVFHGKCKECSEGDVI